MAFDQRKLDRSFNQTRGIFDKFVYKTDDALAEVISLNYFLPQRFFDFAGAIVEVESADGYAICRADDQGNTVVVLIDQGSGGTGMPIAPVGGQYLAEGMTWIDSRVQSANSLWIWSTDTTATDPGTGGVKVNNANLALATELYISASRINAYDATTVLANFIAGDRAPLSQFGSTANNLLVRVDGVPVDNGGWFTIPIVVESTAGGFLNGASIQYESFEQGQPVFGTEYQSGESLSQSSTTSTTFQNKLNLTTSTLPAGNYLASWSFEVGNSSDERGVVWQVQVDNSNTLATGRFDNPEDLSNNYIGVSGFAEVALNGVHSIDIDWARSSGGGNALIRNARLMVYRVF